MNNEESRHAAGLPAALRRSSFGLVRPQDAREVYAFPAQEFPRLVQRGLLHKVARGYYAVVPAGVSSASWRPSLEAAAYGIAASTHGADRVVLMGLSAARLHGAVPRAIAVGVVAVPVQRPAISLRDRSATVYFRQRRTDELDAERMPTDLGTALVTSIEQTVLDLCKSPSVGGLHDQSSAAIVDLFDRADQPRLADLASQQRLRAALQRAERLVAERDA